MPNRTIILTGERGSGKTTATIHLARALGSALTGAVSHPVFDRFHRRVGIDVELLPDGGRHRLALVVERPDPSVAPPYHLAPTTESFPEATLTERIGPYLFSLDTFAAVERHIESHRIGERRGDDVVFILDEIGPLELDGKTGFAHPFETLLTDPRPLVVTVRPSLSDRLAAYCRNVGRSVIVITVDPADIRRTVHHVLNGIPR